MEYNVSGIGTIELKTVVFDLNGTLAVYGHIKQTTKELLMELKNKDFEIIILTSDQRGVAMETADEIGVKCMIAQTSEEKLQFMKSLNREKTIAVGNGRVDIGMFQMSKIRIATLQAEGIHTGILSYVDIIVASVDDAIRLLLDKDAFVSTMKM